MARALTYVALALSLLHAGIVHADPSQRAQAGALIAAGGGPTVWTVDDKGDLLHIQSGMTCPLQVPGDTLHIVEINANLGTKLGDDVSCSFAMTVEGKVTSLTLHAFRAQGKRDQDWFDASVSSLRTAHPAWVAEGEPDGAKLGPHTTFAKPLSIAFSYNDGSEPKRSSIWLSSATGWVVEVRATYPVVEKTPAEVWALLLWSVALKQIEDYMHKPK